MREILDVCCSSRMFWFEKKHSGAVFGDLRKDYFTFPGGRVCDISPQVQFDFCSLPFRSHQFKLIIFDPPHLISGGDTGWMVKKYGRLAHFKWQEILRDGFNECWRVLQEGGTLIFKWNEVQLKIKQVLRVLPQRPLFGHTTTQSLKTHWMVFYKQS